MSVVGVSILIRPSDIPAVIERLRAVGAKYEVVHWDDGRTEVWFTDTPAARHFIAPFMLPPEREA